MLTQRLPYAPNRGDRLRAWHQARVLQEHGWAVTVVALAHDDDEASQAPMLRARDVHVEVARVPYWQNRVRGAMSLLGTRPLTLTLLDSPAMPRAIDRALQASKPDVVLACSSSMAAFALIDPLCRLPLVLDFVDVDSEKWRALAATSTWPLSAIYAREARTLAQFERRLARAAHVSLVTTERERAALLALAPDARVCVLPIGVDLPRFTRPGDLPTPGPRVVFTGVMNYAPNEDGAVWLARDIWPRVRADRPEAQLDIVGATPSARVRALHDPAKGIHVTGTVPDVRPYLWHARTAVAPLRVARGVQSKVLEAAAAGLPCVVSAAVSEGLPEPLRSRCPVGETAEDFARMLVDALNATPDHVACAEAVRNLTWEHALAPLPALLTQAAEARS